MIIKGDAVTELYRYVSLSVIGKKEQKIKDDHTLVFYLIVIFYISYPAIFFQSFNLVNSFIYEAFNIFFFLSCIRIPESQSLLCFDNSGSCQATKYKSTFGKRNFIHPVPVDIIKQCSEHLTIFFRYIFSCKLIPSTLIFTNPLHLCLNPNFLKNTCKIMFDVTLPQLKK